MSQPTNLHLEAADLSPVIEATRPLILSPEDTPMPEFSTVEKARDIIDKGRRSLPESYRGPFLDPLGKMLVTLDYAEILKTGSPGPWQDWMRTIAQRNERVFPEHSRAYEGLVGTLYEGFLDHRKSAGIPPPDTEKLPPLVFWGNPSRGVYTVPATPQIASLGVDVAVVNLPPAYRKNIFLWALLAHETAGHDVLGAYDGLLKELAGKISQSLQAAGLSGTIQLEGKSVKLGTFAAEYWSACASEAAADVCGLLNIGPAHALALIVLLVTARGGKIGTTMSVTNPHPIDLPRLWMASELLKRLPHLKPMRRKAWSDTIDRLTRAFSTDADLELVASDGAAPRTAARFAQELFKRTVPVVTRTIAEDKLDALGGHALMAVQAWNDRDESIALDWADKLVANSVESEGGSTPDLESATHVVAGAVLGMCRKGADIHAIHERALSALLRMEGGQSGARDGESTAPEHHTAPPRERS